MIRPLAVGSPSRGGAAYLAPPRWATMSTTQHPLTRGSERTDRNRAAEEVGRSASRRSLAYRVAGELLLFALLGHIWPCVALDVVGRVPIACMVSKTR